MRSLSPLKKLKHNIDVQNKKVVGRSVIIECAALALLTKQHVMLMGKPGTAKSMLSREIFKPFTDAKYFTVSCTKRMSEEYLVGPLDMKLFRDKGEYRHITSGSLVDAHFAFLDEFLDLPDQSARALLEVLNERTFSRGKQFENSPLISAIAATNFIAESEELEAVEDRFMFRAVVSSLERPEDMVSMLTGPEPGLKYKALSLKDLSALQRKVKTVRIHPKILPLYASFITKLRGAGLTVTDRRAVRALVVLKAVAYLAGRMTVLPTDILSLDKVFIHLGDNSQEQKYASAASSIAHELQTLENHLKSIEKIEEYLFDLNIRVNDFDCDSDNIDDFKTEVEDFIHAVRNDPSHTDKDVYLDYIATARSFLAKLETKTK